MHLAALAGLAIVSHGLLRVEEGALAHVTWRVDRHQGQKLAMKDLYQLTERLTEYE